MNKNIGYCFAIYIIVFIFHGYLYGDNDQAEQLSYVKYLLDKSLFAQDFYIENIKNHVPNERHFTGLFLSLGFLHLEWFCFVLHIFASMLLFLGIFKIAKKFINDDFWVLLSMLFLLLPLYKFNLGGNDLYYNQLTASNLSKAVGVWAIYFFLDEKIWKAMLCGTLATFFHAVAGAQVVLLIGLVYTFLMLKNLRSSTWNGRGKELAVNHHQFLFGAVFFMLTAGVWLWLMLNGFREKQMPNDQFFALINLRIPHHFIPSAFGLKNYLLLLPLFAFGTYFYRQKNEKIFYFFLITIIIAFVYTVLTLFLHSTFLFSTQWFKATIWLKMFATIAVFASVEKIILEKNWQKLQPKFIATAIIIVFFSLKGIKNFRQNEWTLHTPFSTFKTKAVFDICLKIKNQTPQNAVFVQPSSVTSLKVFGERSSFIDYKTVIHSHAGFAEWYKRVSDVYGLTIENRDINISAFEQADAYFLRQKEAFFLALKAKGVTHILTKKNHHLQFPQVLANDDFIVYLIAE
jgi:hypothetical protein